MVTATLDTTGDMAHLIEVSFTDVNGVCNVYSNVGFILHSVLCNEYIRKQVLN